MKLNQKTKIKKSKGWLFEKINKNKKTLEKQTKGEKKT